MDKLRELIPSEAHRSEERQKSFSALLDLLQNPMNEGDSFTI